MTFNRNANIQVLRHRLTEGITSTPTMRTFIHLKLLLRNERFCFVHPVKMMKSSGWEPSERLSLAERALVWFLVESNLHPHKRRNLVLQTFPQWRPRRVLV